MCCCMNTIVDTVVPQFTNLIYFTILGKDGCGRVCHLLQSLQKEAKILLTAFVYEPNYLRTEAFLNWGITLSVKSNCLNVWFNSDTFVAFLSACDSGLLRSPTIIVLMCIWSFVPCSICFMKQGMLLFSANMFTVLVLLNFSHLDVVVQACDPSTKEAETGGLSCNFSLIPVKLLSLRYLATVGSIFHVLLF